MNTTHGGAEKCDEVGDGKRFEFIVIRIRGKKNIGVCRTEQDTVV